MTKRKWLKRQYKKNKTYQEASLAMLINTSNYISIANKPSKESKLSWYDKLGKKLVSTIRNIWGKLCQLFN